MSTTTTRRPVEPFRVYEVTDTRDYEEQGDRMVPIPGSGDSRPCDRCDQPHEVHAYITDVNGDTFVVGTGCATADSKAARSLAGKATRAARKAAEAERSAAAVEVLQDAALYVSLVLFPVSKVEVTYTETGRKVWAVEGVHVSSHDATIADDDTDRLRCLEDVWANAYVIDRLTAEGYDHNLVQRHAGRTIGQALYRARRGER